MEKTNRNITFKVKNKAFSMIELMVTISIIAILLVIALPNFRRIVQQNRSSALSDQLFTSLQMARREAITKTMSVSICPLNSSKQVVCGNSNLWKNGWVVFQDPNSNGVLVNDDDRLMVYAQEVPEINVDTSLGRITFLNSGEVLEGVGTISLYPNECYGDNSKSISISKIGRVGIANQACS